MERHWTPDEYSQEMPKVHPAQVPNVANQPLGFEKPKFDRVAYQREYMKMWRAKKKEQK